MGFLEEIMGSVVTNIMDNAGKTVVAASLFGNLTEWVLNINWNTTLLIITSVLGIIYLIMKIYNQFLETKKFKKNNRIKGLF